MMPDGQVGFVGKDVAEVLGYERPDNAIRNHVEDDDKLMHQISASGQRRNVWFINESGLYSPILSSKLPKAREFKFGEGRKNSLFAPSQRWSQLISD